MPADARFSLNLQLGGQLPLELEYGQDTAVLFAADHLSIADQDFELVQTEQHGLRLSAGVIPWLPVGAQDVRVHFQDGRQVVLEKGFEVKPPLNLTGFTLEPIGPQFRHRPFVVTIRAQGPDAALFQGQVLVRSTAANVDPKLSDPFTAGVLDQRFTAEDSIDNTLAIIVEDYAGHTGISNEFTLSTTP